MHFAQLMPRVCWVPASRGTGEGGGSLDSLHQDVDAGEPHCAGQEDLFVVQVRETRAPLGLSRASA